MLGVPINMDRFYFRSPYAWPIPDPDPKLQQALDIAMDYLELTGQAAPFCETERACAAIIMGVWEAGVRHWISMANYAIVAIENMELPPLKSFYPRAG